MQLFLQWQDPVRQFLHKIRSCNSIPTEKYNRVNNSVQFRDIKNCYGQNRFCFQCYTWVIPQYYKKGISGILKVTKQMIYNSDNLKSRLFKVEDFVFACFLYLLNAINVAEFKLATRVITKMLIMADTTSFTNELVLELVVLVEIS